MEKEKQRKQEMIDYLNTLKFARQQHALNEISQHGSEQYAQHEMDKAQMVGEIVEIVECTRKDNARWSDLEKLMSSLNVVIADSNGNGRSRSEVLKDVLNALCKIENIDQQRALFFELMRVRVYFV